MPHSVRQGVFSQMKTANVSLTYTATMASRGVLFKPDRSDEIFEFSTLGAKGQDSFLGEIYALVANCALELDLLSRCKFCHNEATNRRFRRRRLASTRQRCRLFRLERFANLMPAACRLQSSREPSLGSRGWGELTSRQSF